jgi:hypothetical protein
VVVGDDDDDDVRSVRVQNPYYTVWGDLTPEQHHRQNFNLEKQEFHSRKRFNQSKTIDQLNFMAAAKLSHQFCGAMQIMNVCLEEVIKKKLQAQVVMTYLLSLHLSTTTLRHAWAIKVAINFPQEFSLPIIYNVDGYKVRNVYIIIT